MNIFLSEEIPYDQLEEVGISKEQFLNFPVEILDKLLTGRLSPLLMLHIKTENTIHEFKAKIAFERNKEQIELRVFPVRKDIENKDFNLTKEEIRLLKEGFIIKKRIPKDGVKKYSFLQLDHETKSIISTVVGKVYIPAIIDGNELTKEQQEVIKAGKVLQIETERGKYCIGVDLQEQVGIKSLKGDIESWLKKAIEWDRINPNSIGYWQTSQNSWEYKQQLEESYGLKR